MFRGINAPNADVYIGISQIIFYPYKQYESEIIAGVISGWLPIGKATRNGQLVTKIEDMNSKYGRINFYISPKRLYEETGYVWKGEKR